MEKESEMIQRKLSDKFIMLLSLAYVAVPVSIFFLGWLKILFAVPLCVLIGLFVYKLHQNICDTKLELINKSTKKYWIVTICGSAFWVYLSGIGSFCYQNWDHWVRNSAFRDLSTYSWPVIYDLSQEAEFVQQITGSGKVAFAYYYTWWLPVSALSKLFHLGNMARNILLYFWALLGILLIIYCINRCIGKCSYISTVILMVFSGLDAVVFWLNNARIPITEHIEWWAGYFQYSSNTTQLFWVFNQSIPTWLTVGILLQLKDNRYIAAISSLTFAYSAWATLGMVPIAIEGTLKKNAKIKNAVNVINMILPAIMLVIYGSFYFHADGTRGGMEPCFHNIQMKQERFFVIISYLFFWKLEYIFGQWAKAFREINITWSYY